jgi:hypothetical protein
MVLSTPISSAGISLPPSSVSDSMRKFMITDAVYSKFKRGFETYERNTGKRHPLQSDVVSAGTKRDFAQQDITQMLFHRWSGMYGILRD